MSVTRDQLSRIVSSMEPENPLRIAILEKWYELGVIHSGVITVDERADIVAYYFDVGPYAYNDTSEYEDILKAQELMD
jgi:hypothetical protein